MGSGGGTCKVGVPELVLEDSCESVDEEDPEVSTTCKGSET